MKEVEFIHGIKLKVNDHRVSMHDFKTWEEKAREAIDDILTPGMVVFDIGAEEGESGALAAARVGAGNVHLLEAAPWYWPNIRAVFEANFAELPGGCWPGFVAHETRHADVRLRSKLSNPHWPVEVYGPIKLEGAFVVDHERPEIPAITLDHYIEATGAIPDVILMDVEGAEHRVLIGAEVTLALHPPIIFASIHAADVLASYGTSEEEILAWMEARGYRCTLIHEDHERHFLMMPK